MGRRRSLAPGGGGGKGGRNGEEWKGEKNKKERRNEKVKVESVCNRRGEEH